jgi:hypothetical protein
VEGTCEHNNEHSGFINYGEFLGQLRENQPIKKVSAPLSYLSGEFSYSSYLCGVLVYCVTKINRHCEEHSYLVQCFVSGMLIQRC